ncbi:xanthine dehydrogenase family protein subunit M [Acidovorax sp. sic0104]|uniref:FAD binding domain-containing protein n=1 Tax=Acidovorax sp. sic0104 TaxID=2854784 RepID=UPI001C4384F0|nr:xanthine dehydrogenase family protein subunit M [Acidovorax sp. sic0104]MBV7542684.1 xanthine dehydrogenase family protein subunit M [Acidovorax sp. sic0104]
MNEFTYTAAKDPASAVRAGVQGSFIAGGTNLLDLMKEGVARPAHLIDVNATGLHTIDRTQAGGLLLGALARNAATAYHPLIRDEYPLLTAAILAGASPQIRNMASNGGNLLQRTRCYYFYDTGVPCNKREPGSGCPAVSNLARQHAILGASDQCIATHPSDMCVALAALEATVHVESNSGHRRIAFAEFHRLPGDRPEIDTTLAPGEFVTHIELPPAPQFVRHCAYLKIRERASYAFALVSVAAALQLDAAGRIGAARLALGGVAHKPWRSARAEELLVGEWPEPAAFEKAAAVLTEGARPHGQGPGSNAFKIPMARRAAARALEMAVRGQTTIIPGSGLEGVVA